MQRTVGFIFGFLFCCFVGPLWATEQQWRIDSAWAYLDKGDYDRTVKWVDQSLFALRKNLQADLHADLLNAKGNALRRLGKTTLALQTHLMALRLREQAYGVQSIPASKSWHNIGNCYLDLGEYAKAEQVLRRALGAAKAKADQAHLARIHNSLGGMYQELGHLSEAAFQYQLALKKLNQSLSPHDAGLQSLLFNLSRVHLESHNSPLAMRYIRQLEALHDAPLAPLLALRLRAVHSRQTGALPKAVQYLRKALRQWEQQPFLDPAEWLNCMIELSGVLQQLGEQDEAIGVLQRALLKLNQTPDWKNLSLSVHNNLAALWQNLGKDSLAINHYEQAAALLQPNQTSEQATIYLNLASLYLKQRQFDIAQAYLDGLLTPGLSPDVQANALLLAGQLHEQQQLWPAALQDYSKALVMLEAQKQNWPELFALSSLQFARMLMQKKDFGQAKKRLQEALTTIGQGKKLQAELRPVETIQILATQADLALHEARSYPNPGNWSRSFHLHQRALQFLQSYQRQLEGQHSLLLTAWNYRNIFEGMIETCFAKGQKNPKYLEEAWVYAEMSKAFLLRRILQDAKAKSFAGVPQHYIQEEQQLEQMIKQLNIQSIQAKTEQASIRIAAQLADFEEKKRRLIRTLEQRYPEYYRLKYATLRIDPKLIRRNLDKDQTLVSYFLEKSQLYIFAIDKAGLLARRKQLSPYFELDVMELYTLLKTPSSDSNALISMGQRGLNLYQILLQPVQRQLHAKLLIVPDAQLNYLPFDALLYTGFEKRWAIRRYPFLLKKHAVSYANTAALLPDPQFKRRKNGAFLGMAPTFDVALHKLNYLPNTEAEISLAAKEINLKKQLYSGKAATEAQFNTSAARAKIIHLATHGLLNDRHPDLSCLAFADYDPGSWSKGRLTTAEVYGLKLNAELVFLSACETAIGELYAGEGMLNLTRAFYYAGAKSLVSTLWSIPDNQTMQIVERFYQNLGEGQSKELALQQAKLEYLDQARTIRAHPAFWAAFSLSGDTIALSNSHRFPWWVIMIGLFGLGGLMLWFLRKRWPALRKSRLFHL